MDYKITDLIDVAQIFVTKNGIDYNKSTTIDSQKELNMLLSGTGASSIDELMFSNYKNIKNDTYVNFFNDNNEDIRKQKFNELADKLEPIYRGVSKELERINDSTQLAYASLLYASYGEEIS